MRHQSTRSSTSIESAFLPAGSHSAAFLPRAETPAPLRPHGGAGTPSLLAAIGVRSAHPLVEEVRLGGPRVHHLHARATPPRPSRRRCLGRATGALGLEFLKAVGIAVFIGGFGGILLSAALPDGPSPIILQAEVER